MAIGVATRNEIRRCVEFCADWLDEIGDTADAAVVRGFRTINDPQLDNAEAVIRQKIVDLLLLWRPEDDDNWQAGSDGIRARLAAPPASIDWSIIALEPDRRGAGCIKAFKLYISYRAARHLTDGGTI